VLLTATDRTVHVFDVSTGKETAVIRCSGKPEGGAFISPDAKHLANNTGLYEIKSGQQIYRFASPDSVKVMGFGASADELVVCETFISKAWVKIYTLADFRQMFGNSAGVISGRRSTPEEMSRYQIN